MIAPTWKILLGDVRRRLQDVADHSIHAILSSVPYLGLRRYLPQGHPDQALEIGNEPNWREHIHVLREVFRDCRRKLRPDGTLWVNYGDMYAQSGGKRAQPEELEKDRQRANDRGYPTEAFSGYGGWDRATGTATDGLKPKDLMGMPWRLAFALQDDGWWLRSDNVWAKLNPSPSSVIDRPTLSHEYVFQFSARARYFYDREAVRVPLTTLEKRTQRIQYDGKSPQTSQFMPPNPAGRNLWTVQRALELMDWSNSRPENQAANNQEYYGDFERLWTFFLEAYLHMADSQNDLWTVWEIACQNFKHAHYATFPETLAETVIKASTSEHGCCAACGACWVRVLEPTPEYKERLGQCYADQEKKAQGIHNGVPPRLDGPLYETVGWKPGCACGTQERVPCTVFDPFSGSGTTGLVAYRLGRSYVGTELNPDYYRMSCDRMTAAVNGIPYEQFKAGVLGLFE